MSMEHNKHPVEYIEFSQQASCEFAKEEKEPEIQTEKIPKPNVEEYETSGDESPFPVRMYPCKRHFSDDSSSDVSASEGVAEEESDIKLPKIDIETSEDSEPYPIKMYPCKRHFSDDSSTDSSYFSDSDETIAEEESKINKENSPKDRDDQTPTEPMKESKINKENSSKDREKQLEFDLDPETKAIQLAKSSTTELMSGPTVPTSSILVKHGTKRPVEAEAGDEESKRAKKLALSKSTTENVKN